MRARACEHTSARVRGAELRPNWAFFVEVQVGHARGDLLRRHLEKQLPETKASAAQEHIVLEKGGRRSDANVDEALRHALGEFSQGTRGADSKT